MIFSKGQKHRAAGRRLEVLSNQIRTKFDVIVSAPPTHSLRPHTSLRLGRSRVDLTGAMRPLKVNLQPRGDPGRGAWLVPGGHQRLVTGSNARTCTPFDRNDRTCVPTAEMGRCGHRTVLLPSWHAQPGPICYRSRGRSQALPSPPRPPHEHRLPPPSRDGQGAFRGARRNASELTRQART